MTSITQACSVLLLLLTAFMMPSLLLGMWDGSHDASVFFLCMLGTLFCGVVFYIARRGAQRERMTSWNVLVMMVVCWVVLCVFSSFPFVYGSAELTFANAFFETTSGLTTTGATVIEDMLPLSRAMLLWRSMLQWLGGAGVIAMTLLLFPLLRIGGLQVLQQELSSPTERSRLQVSTILAYVLTLYIVFSILCTLGYIASGLSWFDAINHAMTTVSTGGFSTHSSSIGTFSSLSVEIVAITFMLLCSLPFIIMVRASLGEIGGLWKDSQIRWFLGLLLGILMALCAVRYAISGSFFSSLREVMFNGVSMMTGTGYATQDFALWGATSDMIILLAMLIGGCSGSTTCGLKAFRVAIIFTFLKDALFHMKNPRGILVSFYHGRMLGEKILLSIATFLILYIGTIMATTLLLSILGMAFVPAISGAISAVANVGPGLGPVGPTQTWDSIHDAGKWILSFAMLAGRLEMSIVVVFLSLFLRR